MSWSDGGRAVVAADCCAREAARVALAERRHYGLPLQVQLGSCSDNAIGRLKCSGWQARARYHQVVVVFNADATGTHTPVPNMFVHVFELFLSS